MVPIAPFLLIDLHQFNTVQVVKWATIPNLGATTIVLGYCNWGADLTESGPILNVGFLGLLGTKKYYISLGRLWNCPVSEWKTYVRCCSKWGCLWIEVLLKTRSPINQVMGQLVVSIRPGLLAQELYPILGFFLQTTILDIGISCQVLLMGGSIFLQKWGI